MLAISLSRICENSAFRDSKACWVSASMVNLIFGSVLEGRIRTQPSGKSMRMPSMGFMLEYLDASFILRDSTILNFLLSGQAKFVRAKGYCGTSSTISESFPCIAERAHAAQYDIARASSKGMRCGRE